MESVYQEGYNQWHCLLPVSYTHLDVYKRQQIGADGIVAWMPLPAKNGVWAYEDLLELRKFVEKTGLKVEAVENLPPTHYDRILFGLEGRDSQIENIKTTIRNMGKADLFS